MTSPPDLIQVAYQAHVGVFLCGSYLELDHGAEVVVPEEDAELALLHGGRELTQAVVRQLSGRVVQELLGHDAWHK